MRCSARMPGSLTACRKTAKFFGAFAGGGLCQEHAVKQAREFGIDQFHPQYRQQLQSLLQSGAVVRSIAEIDAEIAQSERALDALIEGVKDLTMRADRTWTISTHGILRRIEKLKAERDALASH